jgi:hypothetical protein
MNNETIKYLLNSPLEAQTLLKTSLKLFIKVFHYYLTKQNFIFKPFHNEIIESIEDIVFDKANKKNLAISISPNKRTSFISWRRLQLQVRYDTDKGNLKLKIKNMDKIKFYKRNFLKEGVIGGDENNKDKIIILSKPI